MKALHLGAYTSYGFANFGKVAAEMLIQLYLFDFYVRLLGLSPIFAGCAFGIAIIWDALSDIILARFIFIARKRGFLYTTLLGLGSVLLSFGMFYLFRVDETSQLGLFFHMTALYILVNTGMTLIDLPQSSLSSELSKKAEERNRLLGSRLTFGILGLMVGSAMPGLLMEGDDSLEAVVISSRMDSACIVSLLVLISGVFTAVLVRGRDKSCQDNREFTVPSFDIVWNLRKNRPFMSIIYASVLAGIGRTINAAIALMYYRLVLNLSEEAVTRMVLPVFTFSIILSIPIWVLLSQKFGKEKPAWIAVFGLGLMGILFYPILPEGNVYPVLLVSVIGGFLSGAVFLVDSMITDIIDLDEKETGHRKEALFFAVWKSVVKISRALAFVVVGLILGILNVDISAGETDTFTKWTIITLFGGVVSAFFMMSGFFLKKVNMHSNQNSVTCD